MKPTYTDNHIKDVIDNFDFKKVRKVMKALNWCWVGRDDNKPPSKDELRVIAIDVLSDVVKDYNSSKKRSFSGTGGFEAVASKQCLSLMFVVEQQGRAGEYL